MKPLEFDQPLILVGGGAIDTGLLTEAVSRGYPVVAADGGGNVLRSLGHQPRAIIGDMDSLEKHLFANGDTKLIEVSEQDTTDFEKCLYSTIAPLYLAFGFLGGRLDHSMAALHCLTKYRESKTIIAIDEVDLMYVPTGPLEMTLPLGSRLSVVPLSPISFRSSDGLEYPLDGLKMALGDGIGVSNNTVAETVRIIPDDSSAGSYVLILSNTLLASLQTSIS